MNSIYGTLTMNSAAVFPAYWYPDVGDLTKRHAVNVELIGTVDRRSGFPIQNLRVSTRGTAVRLGAALPVEENQTLSFFGWYWLIQEVQFDVNAINPQGGALGNPLKNALPELVLKATRRVPNEEDEL